MCDTLVALGNSTRDGSVIFAKNSDRDPNEAHQLLSVPHALHPAGSTVQCTYIEVPQVTETLAVLLSKPFWIWGGEMGANEKGVVIGNEAVFTRVPPKKEPGLIGMDFLRLGLERASSARAALEVITGLLAQFGQGGNCGFANPLYYQNSYLIADPVEAWVLETAGKEWAAVKVKDIRTISNIITIRKDWDLASPGLVDYALEKGWCKKRKDFDFSRCYSDTIYTRFGRGGERQCRTTALLEAAKGEITIQTAMALLRDHGAYATSDWTPAKGFTDVNICMHAGYGPIRINQTTGSMVSNLTSGQATHWLTGTSAPCTGIFKPVWMDAGLPDQTPIPGKEYDPTCLWWRHETLHRETLRDYANKIESYASDRDRLEAEFIEKTGAILNAPLESRAIFSKECFHDAREALDRWNSEVRSVKVQKHRSFFSALAWRGFNQQAKMITSREKIQYN
jgi:secernin